MKYLLLAYTKQADWDTVDVTSPEFLAACAFYEELGAELTASGELLSTEGLAHPALSYTVRGVLTARSPARDRSPSPRRCWSASRSWTVTATTG